MVLAITLHEAAHGYVAKLFGDRTAEMLGRVTLNPVKHIDLVGTFIVPAIMVLTKMPFIFGWAKPVPVNFAQPAPSQARHDLGGGGGAGLQLHAGAGVGAGAGGSGRGSGMLASDGLSRMALRGHPGQPDLDGFEPVADSTAGRRSHPDRASARCRAARVFARIEPFGLFVIVALARDRGARQPDAAAHATGGTVHRRDVPSIEPVFVSFPASDALRARDASLHTTMFADRVLSGMRPTGRMHIGHYHGALQQLGAPAGGVRVPVSSRPTGTR